MTIRVGPYRLCLLPSRRWGGGQAGRRGCSVMPITPVRQRLKIPGREKLSACWPIRREIPWRTGHQNRVSHCLACQVDRHHYVAPCVYRMRSLPNHFEPQRAVERERRSQPGVRPQVDSDRSFLPRFLQRRHCQRASNSSSPVCGVDSHARKFELIRPIAKQCSNSDYDAVDGRREDMSAFAKNLAGIRMD